MRKPRSDHGKVKHYDKLLPGDPFFYTHEDEPISSPNVQVRMPMSLYIKLKEAAAYTTLSEWLRIVIAEKLQRDRM